MKKKLHITAFFLAAVISTTAGCSSNTAQTNPTVVDSSMSITESVVSTDETDNAPESNATSASTAESSADTTKAAEKENTPATSDAATDKTGTSEAATTTKQGNDTTSAPTQTTSKAGSSSSSTKLGAVTSTTTKQSATSPAPTVTTTTEKQDIAQAPATTTTTKKQSTTPAPVTTKSTTTTKKQSTPAPVTTTTKKQTTPAPVTSTTTKKPPSSSPSEWVSPWAKLSAAEKAKYEQKIAERVAYYFGVEIGTKQTLLPGFTRYAMYRAKLLDGKFEHNANDNLIAARATEYGIYYSKKYAEIYGENEGWNPPNGYEGIGFLTPCDLDDASIDAKAKEIVQGFKGSSAHWKYMGLKSNKYIGVGIYWSKGDGNDPVGTLYVFVCQSDANQDAISAAIKECDGNWDLYFEKLDKGEIGPFD